LNGNYIYERKGENWIIMKKALFKDSIKEIKNTYKRFISILLMAFLGVGFFAGLRAASPDMVDTIDKYYDEQNVYDIQIISTLGLKNADIEELSKIENVENIYASYEVDGKIQTENSEIVAKVISLSGVNNPILIDGNMPENESECLVEDSFLKANNKKIGDKVAIEIEDTKNDDGEKIAYLKNKELTIVGTIQSPLYISRDRGTTNLGSGAINYYIYIPSENMNAKDIYTSIYITVKDAKQYTTSSEKYEDYIEEVKKNIEKIKEERENARKQELVDIANKKVTDAENELNNQKADAESKIADAEKQLANARLKIKNGVTQLNRNKQKANTEFANAQKELDKAKEQLQVAEQEIQSKEQEANKNFKELEKKQQELQTNLDTVNATIPTLEIQCNSIIEQLKNTNLSIEQKQQYEAQKQIFEGKIKELKGTKQTLESGIKEIANGITTGKQELENGKKQIQQTKTELEKQGRQLNNTKTTTYTEIEKARKEINNAKTELKDGEQELEKNKTEFNEKIVEAEKELSDAKEKILEIEKPTWYILDRNSNAGYIGFKQDTKAVENIAKVFPIVFFLVATLISLTSMTRMVEEQRTQIGTLKALGYNNFQITQKYILYASGACIVGGFLGMCVGFVLLPKVIWALYGMMYQMIDICISFRFSIAILGLVLISICIVGATIYTALKELKNAPSVLMRPKAPRSGNRVFLEKIPFIWKRLNFSNKVTVRNLFRYKKRFYMTIIGILGCTALILTGFGIKDSITKILPNQFENVFCYDFQITLKESLANEEKENIINEIKNDNRVEKIANVYMTSGELINNNSSENVQIIVPESEETLEGIININDVKTHEKIALKHNEICITDKVSQLLEIKAGDMITLKNADDVEIQAKVSDIVENYVSHYIFMNKTTYEKLYQEEYNNNVILTKNIELTEDETDQLATEIMNKDEVIAINNVTSLTNSIQDMMTLLNYVVVILIVSAGLLAFVVLYNLANVNISERIRELSTIKVLGFYDKEVYTYLTKETIILTVIGIILGLGAGYLLNYYILGTCEINMLRFIKTIDNISYVYAAGITIIFTIIVNIATYFSLKKINMIESLKSIE